MPICRSFVRTSGDIATAMAAVQREVNAIDPGLPLYRVTRMSDLLARQTASARFGSTVLGSFSVVAMLLAAIGIYGVLAFVIGLSRREIAIRLALGATRGRVVRLIVRQGMTLVAFGIAIGLVVAYYATAVLSTQLFGVTATDPLTFAAVPLLLAAIALGRELSSVAGRRPHRSTTGAQIGLMTTLGGTPTLIGLPYDASSSYQRGPADAPAAIREALWSPSANTWTRARDQHRRRGGDHGRRGSRAWRDARRRTHAVRSSMGSLGCSPWAPDRFRSAAITP